MDFIHLLNESPIIFIKTPVWLLEYDSSIPECAFEVYSHYGEIKVFRTWQEANAWRVSQILDYMKWKDNNRD